MIKVLLTGGLGNQMFQYAAGKALSKRLNTDLALDLLYYGKATTGTQRSYELNIFDLQVNHVSSIRNKCFVKSLYFLRKKKEHFLKLGFFADKRSQQFDTRFEDLKDGITLFGYFQNEKYFKDIESSLRKDFSFKKELNSASKVIAEKISNNTNAVSLHVRRGDYVTDVNVSLFTVGDIGYYEKSISYIASQIDNPHFFVFSDDLDWVKQNIDFKSHKVDFVDCNRGEHSYQDMQLMSMCQHNIIANSSFSWWGAWLNKNSQKIVVAPKQWMTKDFDYRDFKGYVPESWIKF